MLTKKDMDAIAEVLATYNARENIALGIANYIGTQNPRFDRDRFLEAANLKEAA